MSSYTLSPTLEPRAAYNRTLCVNSGLSLLALPASGFPPKGGRFTPLSPSAEKPEASRSAGRWLRPFGRGSWRLLRRRVLWTGMRPESPPKGGGHLWWLSDRAYCAAFLHRPFGINRPYAQALLSPALRLITRWFVSPLFAPR